MSIGRFVRVYLGLGILWCLMTNLVAALNGGVSPVMAAAGASAGMAKWIAVAVAIFRQILLWPLEVYERVIRPLFM